LRILENSWKTFLNMLEKISVVQNLYFAWYITGRLYRSNFFHFCSKIWEFNKSYVRKYSWLFFSKMLGKFSGNLGNFSLLGKVINADFLSFLPKKLGILKSRCLNVFGNLGILILLNNYGHLIDVEDNFHFCPKLLGILEISSCFKKFGQFEKTLPNNFGQIMKVILFFGHCRPSQVLSHMKINMLGRTTLGQMSCTLKINVLHP